MEPRHPPVPPQLRGLGVQVVTCHTKLIKFKQNRSVSRNWEEKITKDLLGAELGEADVVDGGVALDLLGCGEGPARSTRSLQIFLKFDLVKDIKTYKKS